MKLAKFKLTDGRTEQGTQVFMAEIETPELFASCLLRAVGRYKLEHPKKISCQLHTKLEHQWLNLNAHGDCSTVEIRLQHPIEYCDRNAVSILQVWADTNLHNDRLSALCGKASDVATNE